MKWEKIKFSELYLIPPKNGLTKPSKIRGSGYKMINMGELFSYDRIYDVPMDLVPLTEKEQENYKVEINDLLFARQSLVLAGAGKCSIVMGISDLTCFESHIIRIRLNQELASPLFYYYYFKSSCSPIKSIVCQGVQAGIRSSELSELKVFYPPLSIQTRIAEILSRYDDLIENYQRQISLLEEAAQRLYKEWFVDLHFPGYENTPIVDGVPEGWEKKNIGSLIKKTARTKQVPSSEVLANGKIPVVDQSRNFIAGYTNDSDTIVDVHQPMIVFGDHTRILKLIQFPFAKGADGTQLILSNDLCRMPQCLLYESLLHVDLSNYSYARHFKYLKEEAILIPTKEIALQVNSKLKSFHQLIQSLRNSILMASEARDRLLPKLMNGEIEV